MGEYGSLSGMRVIVTGASRGIGRAVAIACARHGATVGVNYHRSEAAARELLDTIGSGVLLPFDVGDPEAARAGVGTFVERTGGVDALVNNAAIVRPSLLVSAADEDVEAVVRTNVVGVLNCTRAALAPMLAQRSGVIVNVGSVAAANPCRGPWSGPSGETAFPHAGQNFAVSGSSCPQSGQRGANAVPQVQQKRAEEKLSERQTSQYIVEHRFRGHLPFLQYKAHHATTPQP